MGGGGDDHRLTAMAFDFFRRYGERKGIRIYQITASASSTFKESAIRI